MRLTTDLCRIGDKIFSGSDIIGTVLKIVRRAITVMAVYPIIGNRIVEGANHDGFGRACKGDAYPCPAKAGTLITRL
jgi:hypothetical protein